MNSSNEKLKIMWVCNLMPAFIGEMLGITATNKEGWITGMYEAVKQNDDIILSVIFPHTESISGIKENIHYYGFVCDMSHPEIFEQDLTATLRVIYEDFKPDVIHGFGTEYPYIRAILQDSEMASRTMVHIQGIMEACADNYFAGLPKKVVNSRTFRDILKKDSLVQQKEKFVKRAKSEEDIFKLVKHVCGRTLFDKEYANKKAPDAKYYKVFENLRRVFYEGHWEKEKCDKHRIFISQGNYPLKGLHFAIEAVGEVKKKYPDVSVYIAGDDIVRDNSLLNKIKEPAYGRYLKKLIKKNDLFENVHFLGAIYEKEMKEQFLKCELFVLPSVVENSPNSLGEAMLLGVPSVCSMTGGIPSMADEGKETLYFENMNSSSLAEKILKLFDNEKLEKELSDNSVVRGRMNHDPESNYRMLLDVYKSIAEEKQ